MGKIAAVGPEWLCEDKRRALRLATDALELLPRELVALLLSFLEMQMTGSVERELYAAAIDVAVSRDQAKVYVAHRDERGIRAYRPDGQRTYYQLALLDPAGKSRFAVSSVALNLLAIDDETGDLFVLIQPHFSTFVCVFREEDASGRKVDDGNNAIELRNAALLRQFEWTHVRRMSGMLVHCGRVYLSVLDDPVYHCLVYDKHDGSFLCQLDATQSQWQKQPGRKVSFVAHDKARGDLALLCRKNKITCMTERGVAVCADKHDHLPCVAHLQNNTWMSVTALRDNLSFKTFDESAVRHSHVRDDPHSRKSTNEPTDIVAYEQPDAAVRAGDCLWLMVRFGIRAFQCSSDRFA